MTTKNSQENGVEDEWIFDPELLKSIDFEADHKAKYLPNITLENPGELLQVRPLRKSDYDKNYINLLGQLTRQGDVSREEFEATFDSLLVKSTHYVVVIEDLAINQIVGSGTLVKEQKFIRNCASRGRIEDIIVIDSYRGKQLGKLLLDVLTLLGRKVDCYKLSLECLDHMVKFYKTFGFDLEDGQNYMVQRFHE